MRCDRCEAESPLEGMFKPLGRRWFKSRRMICPGCVRQREKRDFTIASALGAVVLIALGIVSALYPSDGLFINLSLYLVFMYVAVTIHEIGHAIGHRLTGFGVWQIAIGRGRLLLRGRVGGILLELRLGLGGGVLGTTLDMRGWRWRRLICVVAGPLANLAAFVILLHALGGWDRFWVWPQEAAPWKVLALCNALMFVVNLLVVSDIRTFFGTVPSDSKQLIQLLFKPLPAVSVRQMTYYIFAAQVRREVKDQEGAKQLLLQGCGQLPAEQSTDLKLMLGAAFLAIREYAFGRAALAELKESYSKQDSFRAMLCNNLAWADLMIGGEAMIAEADAISSEAYALTPWVAAIQSTRGLALLSRGDASGALPLLKQALKGVESAQNKASVLCSMAMAEHELGNLELADQHVRRARRVAPDCDLMERAEARLAKSPENSAPIQNVAVVGRRSMVGGS